MDDINLYNGDCLEVMCKLIESGVKVDAIITDPPYGTVKGMVLKGQTKKTTHWDTKLDIKELNKRFNLLLREKGVLIMFSQEPYTSEMVTNADKNIPFSYRMIWLKSHFASPLCAKKAPVNYYEDINVFFKKYDIHMENPLRRYFGEVLKYIDKPLKKINEDLGHRKAEHSFYISSTQFKLMTEEVYSELMEVYDLNGMEGYREYEELRMTNKNYSVVFNLYGEKKKSNVLQYKKDYSGIHPTQKPVLLMEDLIKTYTNEGDLVLDFTMGSGTTMVACKNLNRKGIGIELDEGYFNIAKDRVDKAVQGSSLGLN